VREGKAGRGRRGGEGKGRKEGRVGVSLSFRGIRVYL